MKPQRSSQPAKPDRSRKRDTRRGKGRGANRRRPPTPVDPWEVLYGIHPVQEMIKAARRRCRAIRIARDMAQPRMAELRRMADARGIVVEAVSGDQLEKHCDEGRHQGVIAEVSAFPISDLGSVLPEKPAVDGHPLLLALDSIFDPQNLGAILRTASCVGADAVILPRDRSVRPTPAVSKASAGALEHTRLIQVTNLANTLAALKTAGFWVAGTGADDGRPLFQCDLTGPLVLVIGSEGSGIRPLVRQRCDFQLSVPQEGPIGSLNASAAAAVILYEAYRQRSRPINGPTG